jgi:hypothetical protein
MLGQYGHVKKKKKELNISVESKADIQFMRIAGSCNESVTRFNQGVGKVMTQNREFDFRAGFVWLMYSYLNGINL